MEVNILLSRYLTQRVIHQTFSGHFVPRKPEWRKFLIEFFKSFAEETGTSAASPLFMHAIGNTSPAFVSSTGIPFRFMPDEEAARRKRKACQALRANRRKSWIEVVPKTFWEGGLDLVDEIREEAEMEEGNGMEPVKFEDGYDMSASATNNYKGIDPSSRVHFFNVAPRKVPVNSRSGSASSETSSNSLSLELSTPSTPSSYSDDGSSVSPPSPRRGFQPTAPASILLKETDFAAKTKKLSSASTYRRRSSLQPGAKVLRVQTIGGRDIVVRSSFDGGKAPIDYAMDLEKGVADIDMAKDGAVDGAF